MATYTDNYSLIKPSYAEIADVATINTNMNTIDDIMHSSQVSLAPAYDATQTYNTGDVVMYELLMYKCTDDGVTGTWNASKWERTTASECGDSGSDVEANPSGTATEELNKLRVDNTIYSIPEGSEVVVYGEASGSIAEFDDGSNKPMSKCIVEINAVQSGSGDPSPTNIRPISGFNEGNVTILPNDYKKYFNGLLNGTYGFVDLGTLDYQKFTVAQGTLFRSSDVPNFTANFNFVDFICSNYTTVLSVERANKTISVGLNNTSKFDIIDNNYSDATSFKNSVSGVYVIYPLATPITPTITTTQYNTLAKAFSGDSVSVSWQSQAGTVYGGNIDLVSGVLTLTHANIASYDGETLSSTWISDRDVYSVGGTPTTGAQVVYELATPLTYQLTPIQVNSLLGINNVWNDTNGETEVKYIRDLNTTINQLVQHLTYGYGGTPSFNGNDGDVHIVLDSFNKKKGEFMWLNNQWTLIEGSGAVALKVYDNGVEGIGWSVTGGTKNTTNISLTVGSGTFTNYAITDSAVNVTNYSTLTVVCKYRDQNYTKVIDLTNVSGNKYISFLYVTDSNHNECAVGLTDTNSPSPTYRVDSRNGGTDECIMYSCTLE